MWNPDFFRLWTKQVLNLKYLFIPYKFFPSSWNKILDYALQNNLDLINFNEMKLYYKQKVKRTPEVISYTKVLTTV